MSNLTLQETLEQLTPPQQEALLKALGERSAKRSPRDRPSSRRGAVLEQPRGDWILRKLSLSRYQPSVEEQGAISLLETDGADAIDAPSVHLLEAVAKKSILVRRLGDQKR